MNAESPWFVFETKPRQSGLACEEIRKLKFTMLRPTYTQSRTIRGVDVDLEQPLFGTYAFVSFDPDDDRWQDIIGARGVKKLWCRPDNEPYQIPKHESDKLLALYGQGPVPDVEAGVDALIAECKLQVLRPGWESIRARCIKSEKARVNLAFWFFGREQTAWLPRSQVRKI